MSGDRRPVGKSSAIVYCRTVVRRPSAVDQAQYDDYAQGGSGRPTLSHEWSVGGALLYSDTITDNALLVTIERQHFGDKAPAGRPHEIMTRIVVYNAAKNGTHSTY